MEINNSETCGRNYVLFILYATNNCKCIKYFIDDIFIIKTSF